LLSNASDFVLTYEDKDGDWMLVGDVPWRYNKRARFCPAFHDVNVLSFIYSDLLFLQAFSRMPFQFKHFVGKSYGMILGVLL
jgi:hypothetical protein